MRAKSAVLGEGVIGEQGFAGVDDGGDTAPLLVVAAEQEEDLGLEGVAGAVGIEIGEEGVFLEDFEQKLRTRTTGASMRARVVLPTPMTPSMAMYMGSPAGKMLGQGYHK